MRCHRKKKKVHRISPCLPVVGGWWGFRFYLQSPELAREPYRFLNAARIRKGLAPTPDGLARDPEEVQREALRRKVRLTPEDLERVRAR